MDKPIANQCVGILSRRWPVFTRVHTQGTHDLNANHDGGPRGICSGVLRSNLKGPLLRPSKVILAKIQRTTVHQAVANIALKEIMT